MGFFSRLFGQDRSLEDALTETFEVRIQRVKFRFKKLSALDYMGGYKTLIQPHKTYETARQDKKQEAATQKKLQESGVPEVKASDIDKLKEHYCHVFLRAIIEPKLKATNENPDEDGLFVEFLLTDWELATELYRVILEKTFGKKKVRDLSHGTL